MAAATFPLLISCLPAHWCPVKNVAGRYRLHGSSYLPLLTSCLPTPCCPVKNVAGRYRLHGSSYLPSAYQLLIIAAATDITTVCQPIACPSKNAADTVAVLSRSSSNVTVTLLSYVHRVYRVPGFLSSSPNWIPPPPHLQERGETQSLAGEGNPIPTMGQTLCDSGTLAFMYTVYPSLRLRVNLMLSCQCTMEGWISIVDKIGRFFAFA